MTIIVTMTKYQIDPDDLVWDGVKHLKPDGQPLDAFVEELLAREVVDHDDREYITDDHLGAAEAVLETAEYVGPEVSS